jgi:acetate kinase
MRVLALNPGSNSLKFDLVDVKPNQTHAAESKKLLTGTVDNIGKPTKLVLTEGDKTRDIEGDFKDFTTATEAAIQSLSGHQIDLAAVRVVHGGDAFSQAVPFDERVRKEIELREPLAPLHNANSLKIIDALGHRFPIAVAFDTAFHHSLPEVAWRYPIDRAIADRHGIRRFGFHGLSHRFQLERFAHHAGKRPEDCTLITTHLESGSSACAILHGRSIDTSMGFTPLEGLMMGTRSGSVDPAIVPFLAKTLGISAGEALDILEKKSGLQGVSGISLDTRILRKSDDPAAKLALDLFAYRALHYIGAYLAVLAASGSSAEAVILGGGIGENTPEIRAKIAAGLTPYGLSFDPHENAEAISGDNPLHAKGSHLQLWSMKVEEGLQLAHECAQTL